MIIDLDPQTSNMLSRHLTAVCFACAALGAISARHRILALLMTMGIVESYALWRFDFHNGVEALMEGLFPGRSHYTMQTWFITASVVPGLILLAVYADYMRKSSMGHRITATGCAALLAMVSVELISRDDIVRHVYSKIGPFSIFTWWIALSALMIAAGSLIQARPHHKAVKRKQ